jgi:anthranilate phosphoribosyltransferase
MPNQILTEAIDELCAGESLSSEDAAAALREIMEGRGDEVQTAALLIALRAKGETVGEVVGLAMTMRDLSDRVHAPVAGLVDTAGTGGGPTTFNISTSAALVAAAAGVPVAKHGNRSATSKSGSADLLEALGVEIELSPEQVSECIRQIGFGFMFAPRHHAATRHVVPVRKALGVRTVFNFLGPLTNPAGASRQLLGVSDRNFQEMMAEALIELDCERAFVVSADDGLDEFSISAPTRVIEVADNETAEWTVDPSDIGLSSASIDQIAGGSPEENAEVTRTVLGGGTGPAREVTALNAAAAIVLGGVADDLSTGIERALGTIDSGAAEEKLEQLIELTGRLSKGGDV